MKEITIYCEKTVDTFSEDISNSFSYPDPVETFRDMCDGINKELYSDVIKHSNGDLFHKIDDVRVKREIFIATNKTMDVFTKEQK